MKNLLKIILIAVACMAVSCSSKTNEHANANDEENAITVDELLSQAPNLTDSLVVVQGVCTHTCVHGARKIFLAGSDDSNVIRVEACELGSFNPEVVNQLVTVTGYLREDIIDETYLAKWEERLDEKEAEGLGESKAGCETERAAHGVESETARGQIAEYRERINQKIQQGEAPQLSFYHLDAVSYECPAQEE